VNTSQTLKNVKKTGYCVCSNRAQHDGRNRYKQYMLYILKGAMKSAFLGDVCRVTHLCVCACVCVCVCMHAL